MTFADTPLFESTYAESMGRPILPPRIIPDDTARTRRTDPVTSHEAADHNNIAASQAHALALLKFFGPMADHELIEKATNESYLYGELATRFTPSRLRTARHELTELGQVEDTGLYHLTASGRRAKVWQAAA